MPPTGHLPRAPLGRGARWTSLHESAVLVALFLSACAVRLPYVRAAPELTDEIVELDRAFAAYQGGPPLLSGATAYIGPLHVYLLAGVWWLLGVDPLWLRLLSVVAGAASVAVLYVLGRATHSRAAGLVAAVLVAGSGFHILITSHVGWSHCFTPLFSAGACAALAYALRRRSGVALASTGLLFGLAVQTHLLAGVLLPGAGALALWRQPRLLLSRWGAAACALFLLATASYPLDNLRDGLRTLRQVNHQRGRYHPGEVGPSAFVGNLRAELPAFGLTLIGDVSTSDPGAAQVAVGVVVVALAAAVLVQQAARGNAVPLAVAAPALLALPLLTGKYALPGVARYFMPMALLVYAAAGAALVDLAAAALRTRASARVVAMTALVAAAVLTLPSLVTLAAYYRALDRAGSRSEALFAASSLLRDTREALVLDNGLGGRLRQGVDQSHALRSLLAVDSVTYEQASITPGWLQQARARAWEGSVVLPCRAYLVAVQQPGVTARPLPGVEHVGCVGIGVIHVAPG